MEPAWFDEIADGLVVAAALGAVAENTVMASRSMNGPVPCCNPGFVTTRVCDAEPRLFAKYCQTFNFNPGEDTSRTYQDSLSKRSGVNCKRPMSINSHIL